jgi:hypothetical protein
MSIHCFLCVFQSFEENVPQAQRILVRLGQATREQNKRIAWCGDNNAEIENWTWFYSLISASMQNSSLIHLLLFYLLYFIEEYDRMQKESGWTSAVFPCTE